MTEWRVYYADGSTFDSDDGPWEAAPLDGVICIARRAGERVDFYSGGDFYRRFDDGSFGVTDDPGPWLRTAIAAGEVKFGLYISNRKFEAIMRRASEEWR